MKMKNEKIFTTNQQEPRTFGTTRTAKRFQRKSSCGWWLINILLMLFTLNTAWAQDYQGRPLRMVQDEALASDNAPSTPQSPLLTLYSLLSAPYSLLSNTPDIEQPLTQHYIAQYSSPGGIAWLNAVVRRGEIFIPFIREELRKRNLPPELLYLPVIESGFQSGAKSKSGAVGLWQFMMNSIAPFDMKVNDMVDERRDFQKATRGALQKLEDNYRFFGNWPLALAAYNAGLGGVNRAVQKAGTKDYWLLCEKKELRTETAHYVPKLLAAAWVLSQPRRFGIDSWPENMDWKSIPVGREISLDMLAAEAGVSLSILQQGNRELNYGITPSDGDYRLKVPAQAQPLVAGVLSREDLKLLRHYRYTIKYGDTLSALARHYGVSISLIEQANPGISNRYLKIGEAIIIPAFKEVAPYGGPYGGPSGSPSGGKPSPSGDDGFSGIHLVKKGETLWSLALAYSVDPETLARANGMELNQTLPEGKTLKVPIIE